MNKISLLYFDGCPSWQPALENLKKVIEDEKILAEISLVKVEDPDQAQQEQFLGSPSIRVNGIDLWPEERANYMLSCRVYKTPAGIKGSPTIEMLRERLREVISSTEKTN
jgi:hypothetical protein